MDIYDIVEQYLSEGRGGVLATVIKRLGSAPRDVGARMFVGEDGSSHGTIGGGVFELDAFNEAMLIMNKEETKVLRLRMDSRDVADSGMLCGGDVDILLEPVLARYGELYKKINLLEGSGRAGIVVTKFAGDGLAKTLVDDDGRTTGDVLTEGEFEAYRPHMNDLKPLILDGAVVEPLRRSSVLYIFGGGHVGQYISKIAKIVGFYVVVIDDRVEFANRERFPEADQVMAENFIGVFNKLRFTGSEYAVIVTRGHQFDAHVLRETMKRPAGYIGMIGSRRKVGIVFDYMRECGFSDAEIEKVHAPVGLGIHAETPQEIAVSIVAQLIKVRGERQYL